MNPFLKQLAPCIQMCERVETLLSTILHTLPPTDANNHLGREAFNHTWNRNGRSADWGVSYTLEEGKGEKILDHQPYSFCYVWFRTGESFLAKFEYDPVGDIWEADVLDEVAQGIMDGSIDPDTVELAALDSGEQELPTPKAFQHIAAYARWAAKGPAQKSVR